MPDEVRACVERSDVESALVVAEWALRERLRDFGEAWALSAVERGGQNAAWRVAQLLGELGPGWYRPQRAAWRRLAIQLTYPTVEAPSIRVDPSLFAPSTERGIYGFDTTVLVRDCDPDQAVVAPVTLSTARRDLGGAMQLQLQRTVKRPRPSLFRAITHLMLAAVTALTAGCTGGAHHSTASTAPTGMSASQTSAAKRAPSAVVPASRTKQIAHAITSSDRTTLNAVLAPGTLPSGVRGLLPAGTVATVTGPAVGRGTLATVPITLTGAATDTWRLLLVDIHGTWLVYGTRKARP